MSKSKISRDELLKLYNDGLSQIKIAQLYGTTTISICRLMKKYDIKARSHKDMSSLIVNLSDDDISSIYNLYNSGLNRLDISKKLNITEWSVRKILNGNCRTISVSLNLYHKNNTTPLSYVQEQLILGSLLGDASLAKSKDDQYEFQVSHCLEQKDYLAYKAKILCSNTRSYIKGADSYSAGKDFFCTSYCNKYELKKIYELCFNCGIKTVTNDWVQALDPLAIAIWFMDDGSSSFNSSSINARFSTLSFDKNQLQILQNRLNEFNIETTLQKHRNGLGLIICVRQKSINKFMDLIEPHIVDCMKYKIKRRINEPDFKFSGKDIRSANGIL